MKFHECHPDDRPFTSWKTGPVVEDLGWEEQPHPHVHFLHCGRRVFNPKTGAVTNFTDWDTSEWFSVGNIRPDDLAKLLDKAKRKRLAASAKRAKGRKADERKQKPTRHVKSAASPRDGCEVHQQLYGNRNYCLVRKNTGEVLGDSKGFRTGKVFTVFTKDDSCGRGEYAEEIDVLVQGGVTAAKQLATAVLGSDEYSDGLRASRAVERVGTFF